MILEIRGGFLLLTLKKKPGAVVILLLIGIITLIGCNKDIKSQGESTEAVAVVNGESISYEDFNRNFRIIERMYNTYYTEDIWSKEIGDKTFLQLMKEQIVEKLVTEQLVVQRAKELGISIDNDNVEKMYDDFKAQLKENEELNKFYEENGIDEDFIKRQIEIELYIEGFKNKIIEEAGLLDSSKLEEILKDYVVQVKASHILIKDKAKAQEVLERAKKGEDFAELAKEFSEDLGSKNNGGDLGYFGRDTMGQAIEQAAFSLDEGQISDLVESGYGYHIIKVFDKKTFEEYVAELADEKKVEEEKQAMIEIIKQEKYMDEVESLKEGAEIEIFYENIR